MRFVAWTTMIAFALLVLPSGQALAQPAGDPTLAEAKAHYEAGRAAYEARDYARAVSEYEAANRLKQAPKLYFNIGLAYEGMGRAAEAAANYRQYLALMPDAENRADVERRMAALDQKAAQQPPPPVVAPPPDTATPPPPDTAMPPQPTQPVQQGETVPAPPPEPGMQPTQPAQAQPPYQYPPGYSPSDPYGGYVAPRPYVPRKRASRWWIPVVVVGSIAVTIGIIALVAWAANHNTTNPVTGCLTANPEPQHVPDYALFRF
jgi:tetratricopeptide (TPR) repeat protein